MFLNKNQNENQQLVIWSLMFYFIFIFIFISKVLPNQLATFLKDKLVGGSLKSR